MQSVSSGEGTAYPSGAPVFTPVFSGVRVTRSFDLYECFVDRCLVVCTFSLCHCADCILILITPLVSSNSSSYKQPARFSPLSGCGRYDVM
jgi:hypothetical protein